MVKRGFYRHYKGGLYFVLGTGKHSETGEELVFYYTLHFYQFWARPADMWNDTVEASLKYLPKDRIREFAPPHGEGPLTFKSPRFQKISALQAFKLWFKKPNIS